VCVLLSALLGSAAGWPAISSLEGLNTGYPVTQLAVNLVFGLGMLIGVWAIIGVLSDAGSAFEAIKGASWGWVALSFVLAQLPVVAEGWALLGAAVGDLPFGRCVALELSNTLVPRLRRLASRRIRPYLANIWANVKTIAAEPRRIVYVLTGTTLSQLLTVLALGASLHAVGQQASIATLITVTTLAAIVGGAVPQDQAVAAVLIQRLFTAYLPPIWGWATLAWMRR